MPAGRTYTPLARTTLTSTQSSISFTSISSAYTDLVLVVTLKGSVEGFAPRIRFNNDTGNNYSWTRLSGNGSTASSGRVNNTSNISLGSTANVYGADGFMAIAHIQNYANTNIYKTAIDRGNNATDGAEAIVGLWRDTSAINRVDVVNTSSANFNIGCTATLYGILAA